MKLLDSARNGGVVIVWKLDRAARSVRQIIETTVLLNERGVELHSFTENINTTPPSGKLNFHIFAAWPSLNAIYCARESTPVSKPHAGGDASSADPRH